MDKLNVLTFIKFGSEKNILDLYENGTIYCNTIEFFRKMEDELLRGDSYEGTTQLTYYPPDSKITIQLAHRDIELKTAKLFVREFYTEIPGNIYCMTAITREEIIKLGTLTLDPKNARFGSHFLLIKNNEEFYHRLMEGFEKAGLKIKTGFVEYYNKYITHDTLGLFHKCNEFEYQKEFRILINNSTQTPIKIQLGSLKEISQVFETKDLETLICKYNPEEQDYVV